MDQKVLHTVVYTLVRLNKHQSTSLFFGASFSEAPIFFVGGFFLVVSWELLVFRVALVSSAGYAEGSEGSEGYKRLESAKASSPPLVPLVPLGQMLAGETPAKEGQEGSEGYKRLESAKASSPPLVPLVPLGANARRRNACKREARGVRGV